MRTFRTQNSVFKINIVKQKRQNKSKYLICKKLNEHDFSDIKIFNYIRLNQFS